MANSDWNRVHITLDVWYGNGTYDDAFAYPNYITRLNENVLVLGKSGADTTWCPYQLDELNYSKVADMHVWADEMQWVSGLLLFNNKIFISSGNLDGVSYDENNNYLFMIDSDGNKYKVIDVKAGIGVPAPPGSDYWTGTVPRIAVLDGKLYFMFTYSRTHIGYDMHHFLYSSPNGSDWYQELDFHVPGDGTGVFNEAGYQNFLAPSAPRGGLALFNNTDHITTSKCYGFKKVTGSTWSQVSGLTPATHRYDRLFIPYAVFCLHATANGHPIERTTNFLDSTTHLPDSGASAIKGVAVYAGTWWESGRNPLVLAQNLVYYWDPTTTSWANDANFSADPEAGEGFILANVMGRLWGIPAGYYGGIWYRDKTGFGFLDPAERKSNKLSIDRDESVVYVSTYTSMETPDFWRVESDLSDVNMIAQSTISGAPGLVQSYYNNHILLGGMFYDYILKYSDDYYVTFSGIAIPSGVEWATATEQLLGSTNLENLFVATYSGADNHLAMNYAIASGGLFEVGSLPFWMLGTCREDIDIFGGQGEAVRGGMDIVEYTKTMGVSFEERDIGLPDKIITDMEFA